LLLTTLFLGVFGLLPLQAIPCGISGLFLLVFTLLTCFHSELAAERKIQRLREVLEIYNQRREQPNQPPLYFRVHVVEFEKVDRDFGTYTVKEYSLIIACQYYDEERSKNDHRGVDDSETTLNTDSTSRV